MTPKAKAKELFNKYSKGKDAYGWNLCEFDSSSKKCALIAVDEIINMLLFETSTWRYWKEVKQEIELL